MSSELSETKPQMSEEERPTITRLMLRMPRKSLLRRVIDAKTGAILSPGEAASHLATLLNTTPETKWRERLIAVTTLRYVPIAPDEESAVALALGKALQTNYMKRIADAAIRWSVCFWAAITAFCLSAVMFDQTGDFLVLKALLSIICAFLCLATALVFFLFPIRRAARNAEVQVAAIKTLAFLQLPESVGTLAKASRAKERLSDVTRNALVQLLPTLAEEHYGRLPNDATPELCALLFDKNTSEHLISLTVEALGKVGDGRAVEPMIKFLSQYETPKLREWTASILPVLMARREQENASRTLLRHSSAPPVDAAQLLRAASASAATPPELLLRPSAGTDAPPSEEA